MNIASGLKKIMGMEFELDHIVPQSKGGSDAIGNLSYACSKCNGYKSNRIICIDPDTDEPSAIFNPRIEKWSEHFTWSDNYTKIVGLSATGRATASCLRLDNPLLNEARIEWRKSGWTPPTE